MKFPVAVLCCAALMFTATASVRTFGEDRLPNVVFILADDIGYGDVSCYGAVRVQTPNIDRLAAGGLRFTDGHAPAATCTPTRYALMTGQYPWRKQGTNILPGDAALIIPPGSTTLPSIMKSAGYVTGVVGKWHLGLGTPENPVNWNGKISPGPLEVGFDYSFIFPATNDRVPCVYVENHHVVGLDPNDPIQVSYKEKVGNEPIGRERPDLLKLQLIPGHAHDDTIVRGVSRYGYMTGGKSALWIDEDITDTITSKACEFIGKNKTKPFFLYFATHDIHVPRVVHQRFAGKTPMGARGDMILQLDWSVGEILRTLDEHGLTENTLVIFSSDNGPSIDDGYVDHAGALLGDHRPCGPLRGGKGSMFEGGTRVPFIVQWPKRIKPGVSNALVCQIDFPATFAALVNRNVPQTEIPDSENVLSALLGDSPTGREFLVQGSGGMTLRHGPWKIILPSRGRPVSVNLNIETGCSPEPQLYRLDTDLGEQNNLADVEPERWERMRAKLQEIRGIVPRAIRNFKPISVEKPERRLDFSFRKEGGTKIEDSSGNGNHGTVHGTLPFERELNGRRFDGNSYIDIDKSPSLGFARTPWTTEIEFSAESPDGTLVSVGGALQGYTLGLEKGRPVFSATIDEEIYRLVAPKVLDGRCNLTAIFTKENAMVLYVGNEKVAERKLPSLVPVEPSIAWRIGTSSADVSGGPSFVGVLFSVRLFAGEVPPQTQ